MLNSCLTITSPNEKMKTLIASSSLYVHQNLVSIREFAQSSVESSLTYILHSLHLVAWSRCYRTSPKSQVHLSNLLLVARSVLLVFPFPLPLLPDYELGQGQLWLHGESRCMTEPVELRWLLVER